MSVSQAVPYLLLMATGLIVVQRVMSCNEAVCASVVSKCQLMQRCNCDSGKFNSTCSMECFKCLDYLYLECCSCVDICPKRNESDTALNTKSHVEELTDSLPLLFSTLTEENDTLGRWTSYTYPVKLSFITTLGSDPKELDITSGAHVTTTGDGLDQEEDLQSNCTVAFMSDCMPFNKCKSSCTSMGSSAYRWFHDGCCQCVGEKCINYGLNESRCRLCPIREDEDVSQMVVDGHPAPPTEDGSDYEVGPPPPPEEEDSRQENSVKKEQEEKEKKTEVSKKP